jgi:hypothetical protein
LAVPPGVDAVPVSTVHQAISETLNAPAVSPLEVR